MWLQAVRDRLQRRLAVRLRLVLRVRRLRLRESAAARRLSLSIDVPGHRLAHHFAGGGERSPRPARRRQRVAQPALRGAAAHQGIGHRIGRGRLRRALAGMRHGGAQDHERQAPAPRRSSTGSSGAAKTRWKPPLLPRVFASERLTIAASTSCSGSALARSSASRFSVGCVENQ